MADKKAETQMNDKKKKQGQAATLKKVFRHLGKYRIFVVFSIFVGDNFGCTYAVCPEAHGKCGGLYYRCGTS